MVRIKRVYEQPSVEDGYRILVDRLWPRGMSKNSAAVDLWLKEIAPSTSLRKWFSHDPRKWDSFRRKYKKELQANESIVEELIKLEKAKKVVTLLYSAKDEKYNQAVVLQEAPAIH